MIIDRLTEKYLSEMGITDKEMNHLRGVEVSDAHIRGAIEEAKRSHPEQTADHQRARGTARLLYKMRPPKNIAPKNIAPVDVTALETELRSVKIWIIRFGIAAVVLWAGEIVATLCR